MSHTNNTFYAARVEKGFAAAPESLLTVRKGHELLIKAIWLSNEDLLRLQSV